MPPVRLHLQHSGEELKHEIQNTKYQPKDLIGKLANPVRGNLFIQLTSFIPGGHNEWRLYDMNGRMVHSERFSSQTIDAAMPAVSAGLYVLEVRMNDKMERAMISKLN